MIAFALKQAETGTPVAEVKRRIVRDCLSGLDGRAKVEGWVPRWMGFPTAAHTARSGVPTVARVATVASLVATPEPLALRRAD